MKMTCNQRDLNTALTTVRRTVPSRSSMPATQHVMMERQEGMLKLTTTNLSHTTTTWIPVNREERDREEGEQEEGNREEGNREEGKQEEGRQEEGRQVCLPAKLLGDLIASIEADEVSIESNTGTPRVKIQAGRTQSAIIGGDPKEFPVIAHLEPEIEAQVDAGVFRRAVARVVIAVATDDSRPVLTGVSLKLEEDRFTLAAADGFRLAVQKDQLSQGVDHKVQMIIPAQSMREMQRLMPGDEGTVRMVMSKDINQILFQVNRTVDNEQQPVAELISQLIPGAFPEYDGLIPQGYESRVEINTRDLMRASKSASMFSEEKGAVRLSMEQNNMAAHGDEPENQVNSLVISGNSREVGEYSDTLVPSQMEGKPGHIAFNPKYLNEFLQTMENKNICIEITNQSSPGVFRLPGDDNFVHVVMPVFVQD